VRRFHRCHRLVALALIFVAGGGGAALALARHDHTPIATGRAVPGPGRTPMPAPQAPAVPGQGFAPAVPVRIDIPSIAVSAPVDPVGLNPDGSLEVPKDFDRAGYYTGRPTPGEIGPAVIEGHVDSTRRPAVFYRLRKLRGGDEVVITRADGTRPVFVVDRLEEHSKDAFPTEGVYGRVPEATLRLITCAGTFDRRTGRYRDNLIVFARLKGTP
jgi:sortase (surface protein transpeptidase)